MGDASRPLGVDDDLIELLWCNGHVVMQSQTHRKLPPRPEKAAAAAAAAAAAVQEDEGGLWFPFSHADSLDKDIFSDLFCDAVPAVVAAPPAGIKPDCNGKSSDAQSELMPPPKSTMADGGDLSDLVQARTGKAAMDQDGASASSTLSAIGASFCGSNQVQVQQRAAGAGRVQSDTAAYGSTQLPSAVGSGINANARGGHEATVASSSGRSNGCFGTTTTTTTEPTSTSHRSSKRKRLHSTEDSESPSEDAESESLALERKPPQKLTTARRSRAAEVHNLSERRRRDRINEKMKALQELIPHCNKTDKASMLDEAIEYLKSLQMQVQMMWMGSGMAPPAVMFPGMHQYLPPRMPSFMAPHPQPATAAQSLPEHYAHFLGVNHHLQPPSHHHHQHYAAQGMGYYPLGAKVVQQSPALPLHHVPAANGGTPAPAAATTNNTPGNGDASKQKMTINYGK